MENKKIILMLVLAVVIIGGIVMFSLYKKTNVDTRKSEALSPKDATYNIDGQSVTLVDGVSVAPISSDSASIVTTRYFGNEITHDLDGDNRPDVVFILTQNTGGSGTFYYVVAALNTVNGYIGSDAILLGDRIAPQTIKIDEGKTANGTNRQNVIVVNYADRKTGEAFTVPPSVGKSIWIKLDPKTMQFGEVAQNFEGETASLIDGRQCYTYNHEATKTEPYTVNEFLDITIDDTKVAGTKNGTQQGPDMTNGYTGTIVGTLDKDTINAVFSYTVEGSKNKETEIYRARKDQIGLEKLRYPLIEKSGVLVPDTSKEFTALLYARVGCTASN